MTPFNPPPNVGGGSKDGTYVVTVRQARPDASLKQVDGHFSVGNLHNGKICTCGGARAGQGGSAQGVRRRHQHRQHGASD